MRNFFDDLRRNDLYALCAVLGVMAVILGISEWSLVSLATFNEDRREWYQYLLLGTLAPLFFVSTLFAKHFRVSAIAAYLLNGAAAIGFICLISVPLIDYFWLRRGFAEIAIMIVIAIIQWLFVRWWRARAKMKSWSLQQSVATLFTLIALWVLMPQLITLRYANDGYGTGYSLLHWLNVEVPPLLNATFLRRLFLLVGAAIGMTWFWLSTSQDNIKSTNAKRNALIALDVLFIVIFALICFRTDRLLSYEIQMHRDYFILPVLEVRQGAWLLWDAPSQYGVLWVWLTSLLPIADVNIALSVFIALCNLAFSGMLYFVFRRLQPTSIVAQLISFIVVLACFLIRLFPGRDIPLDANNYWYFLSPVALPQSSAIRTIACCMVLIWTSVYALKKIDFWKWAIIGNSLWSLGTLLSGESAVYSFATWIPAFILAVIQTKSFRALSVPVITLGLPVALISLYYFLKIQHAPEWVGFFEHSFTVLPGTVWGESIPRAGAIWGVFAIFVCISALVFHFARLDWRSSIVALGLACFGAIYSVTSYYVASSVNYKLTVILHVYFLAIALLTIATQKLRTTLPLIFLLAFSAFTAIPIVNVLDVTPQSAIEYVRYWFSPQPNYFDPHAHRISLSDFSNRLGAADDDLESLINKAHIAPDEPIVLAEAWNMMPARQISDGSYRTEFKLWLPAVPVLSKDRQITFISRFTKRVCSGGWLAWRSDLQSPSDSMSTDKPTSNAQISQAIISDLAYFTADQKFSNKHWLLVHFTIDAQKANCIAKSP